MNDKYINRGLTNKEVQERISANKINITKDNSSKGVKDIIISNTFNLFNAINILLAILVLITGHFRNMLFMGIVIINTITGIYQELKAKKKLDQLKLLNNPKATLIRDAQEIVVSESEIVIDDLMILKTGDEILCDAIIIEGNIEVNESMLTGESDNIAKHLDDEVLAGSFVTSGYSKVRVNHVGYDNYMAHILKNIKKEKRQPSVIRETLDRIIKTITVIIIPLGLLIFFKQFILSSIPFDDAIIQTVASVVGMIPEGLVLLTTVALSIGCLNLSYEKTLVQEIYSLETLARVNTLCLDKTGTLTNGKMKVIETINIDSKLFSIIASIYNSLKTSNMTAKAIIDYFCDCEKIEVDEVYEFSSSKKYSGARIGDDIYKIGAYTYLLETNPNDLKFIESYTKQGYRVLTVTKNDKLEGYIIIEDELRNNVKETVQFFNDNDVNLKIISGDDMKTVSAIAHKAGVKNTVDAIDCGNIDDDTLKEKVLTHTVFGRVTPDQKYLMIKTLKENGYTVGMVGDGVNDTMALKEADFSISFLSAADSARNIANVILMDDDFSHMPSIVKEGRRVINNINRTSTLFLSKTAMSILLTVATIFIMKEYPFTPIQLTLLSTLCIGIPSFVLSLEPDYNIVKGSFARNIISRAVPSAISIVIAGFVLEVLVGFQLIESTSINTIYSIFTLSIFISNIIYISIPINVLRASLIALGIIGFLLAYFIFADIFYFVFLTTKEILITLCLIIVANLCLFFIGKLKFDRYIK
ncbi:MAG: HAD-IC family P-type ATPase [Erysipelotrichaceae bacterium]